MRTKQEVIQFLESKVGTTVPCKGNPSLDGQCVTLMKALLEFLGAPDPYKARGHAKTVISAYLSEGIADPGTGFLSVFSNKNMGVVSGIAYGHIWCNVGDGDGTYYESNGQKPLTVTKGKTYTYDSVCNFDKYIKEGEPVPMPTKLMTFLDRISEDDAIRDLTKLLGVKEDKCDYGSADLFPDGTGRGGDLGAARRRIKELEAQPAPTPTPTLPPNTELKLVEKMEHRGTKSDEGDFDELTYK